MPNFEYEGFKQVVMTSAKAPMHGQNERSSKNYLFDNKAFKSCKKIKWQCPEGITFRVKRDHKAAKDDTVYSDLCNGSIVDADKMLKDGEGIYIALPKPEGVNTEYFDITVIALD